MNLYKRIEQLENKIAKPKEWLVVIIGHEYKMEQALLEYGLNEDDLDRIWFIEIVDPKPITDKAIH